MRRNKQIDIGNKCIYNIREELCNMSNSENLKTNPIIVKEVIRLSQEEGYSDEEIAEEIGYTRAHVCRIRLAYDIPKRVLENRKDKRFVCPLCNKVTHIRRKESGRVCCDDCVNELEQEAKRRDLIARNRIDTSYEI